MTALQTFRATFVLITGLVNEVANPLLTFLKNRFYKNESRPVEVSSGANVNLATGLNPAVGLLYINYRLKHLNYIYKLYSSVSYCQKTSS